MAIQVVNDLPVGEVTVFFHQFGYAGTTVKSLIIKNHHAARY